MRPSPVGPNGYYGRQFAPVMPRAVVSPARAVRAKQILAGVVCALFLCTAFGAFCYVELAVQVDNPGFTPTGTDVLQASPAAAPASAVLFGEGSRSGPPVLTTLLGAR